MFRSNTVFVLGAGASKEVGLPIGGELTQRIADFLDIQVDFTGNLSRGDYNLFGALKSLAMQEEWRSNAFINSAREIGEAMQLALSIDTFLESHRANREFVLLGKLGIAAAIVAAERGCTLTGLRRDNRTIELSQIDDTWYYRLARLLFTGVDAEAPDKAFKNVSFIVFNYDRCLQHFLFEASRVYFRLEEGPAAELVKRVRIFHPYGSLGSIFQGEPDHLPFGSDRPDLNRVSGRIKTFTESCDNENIFKSLMIEADTIVFLGFGFHEQNLKLLDISGWLNERSPKKRVFATTLGMSPSDQKVVKAQLDYALSWTETSGPLDHIELVDARSSELLDYFWRSLIN